MAKTLRNADNDYDSPLITFRVHHKLRNYLKNKSKVSGKSISQVLRELVEKDMKNNYLLNNPVLQNLGCCEGPGKDLSSREIDREIYTI